MPYAADDEFVMPARSRDLRGVTPVPVTRLIYKLFVRVAAVPRVRTLCLQCAPWADRMRLLLCYRSDCRAELGGGGLVSRLRSGPRPGADEVRVTFASDDVLLRRLWCAPEVNASRAVRPS